jgi:hypothetical protein
MGFFKDCGCGCNGQKAQEQFTISVISGLTFFLVANPQLYMIMRNLIGSRVASVNGNPTMFGLVLHSIVFTLIVWMMMKINKKERYEPSPGPGPAEKKAEAKAPEVDVSKKAAPTADEIRKIAEEKRKAIMMKKEGASGPAPKTAAGPGPAAEGVVVDGPAPHMMNGIEGFQFAMDGFDLQLADFDGPAPKKAMVCNCPDGSTLTMN